MDRERAETFLRLLAEAELRDAITPGPGDAPPDVLGDLPERQREAITLQHRAGLSEAETAAAMRISRGAVRAHTTRAMARLPAASTAGYARLRRAAQVLTTVGAVGEEVAAQILNDTMLALDVRQLGLGSHRTDRLLRSGWRFRRSAGAPANAPGSASPPGLPGPQAGGGPDCSARAADRLPGHEPQRRTAPAVVRTDGARSAVERVRADARPVRPVGAVAAKPVRPVHRH